MLRRRPTPGVPELTGNLADRCTDGQVITAEVHQRAVAPYPKRPGPRSGFTDSELLTASVVAELTGLAAETRCPAYLRRNHPTGSIQGRARRYEGVLLR